MSNTTNNEPAKNKKHFIDKNEFLDEVIKSQKQGKVTERLGQIFLTLSEKYTQHKDFVRYPPEVKQDLINEGTIVCLKGYDKFDPERSNANVFAFFTLAVRRAFIQYVMKEYKQKNIRDEMMVENGLNPSWGYEETKEKEQLVKEEDDG